MVSNIDVDAKFSQVQIRSLSLPIVAATQILIPQVECENDHPQKYCKILELLASNLAEVELYGGAFISGRRSP